MVASRYLVTRIILIVLSVLTVVIGIAVFALGSATIDRKVKFVEQFAQGSVAFPIVLLIFGIFITISGIFSSLSALDNNVPFPWLFVYTIAGMLLFIGEFVGGILVLNSPEHIEREIKREMKKAFETYHRNETGTTASKEGDRFGSVVENKFEKQGRILHDAGIKDTLQENVPAPTSLTPAIFLERPKPLNTTKIIDALQKSAKCCGFESYKDWTEKYKFESPPKSCCKNVKSCDTKAINLINKDGCYEKTMYLVKGAILAFGYMSIVLAFFQIAIILMACALSRNKKPNSFTLN